MTKHLVDRRVAAPPFAPCVDDAPRLAAILHVVTDCIVNLNAASSPDGAAPQALSAVGGVLGVERILVLEAEAGAGNVPGLTLRYQWTRSDIMPLDQAYLSGFAPDNPDIADWLAPLRKDEHVFTTLETANATVTRIFRKLGIASILVVPIFVENRFWGQIGFHSSDSSRIWTVCEIDILRTLAELIGTTTQRAIRRKQAAETRDKLAFSNILLTAAMENSPDGILVANNINKILTYNRRFLEMWNIAPERAAAGIDEKLLLTVVTQLKDPEKYIAHVRYQHAHRDEIGRDEIEFKDGRVFDERSTALRRKSGEYIGRIWFYRDITDLVRTREALEKALTKAEQAESTLVDAINCISEAFVIFDKDDRLLLCNDLYWQLYPPSTELLKPGVSFEELLRYNLDHGAYTDAIGREEEWFAEHIRMHQQANLVVEQPWYDGRYLMVTDRRMKSGGTAGLRIDITKLVQTREALEKALDKAEAVNQAKTLFLANMSHELRTPLNAVIGFSQLIKDQTLGPAGVPAYVEYAKDIYESGEHLLEIINNVLDASRIEVGKFELKDETVEIGELVRSAMMAVRVQAAKKAIALEQRLPDEPIGLRADTLRLRQILINLLANAVKFTPEGGRVTLSFEASPAAAVFAVADTGIGMTSDEITTAIEPFQQIENALIKRHEGVGLGLALAKQMREMHGGTLEIESEKDAGTTVRVVLPAERILRPPKASAAA